MLPEKETREDLSRQTGEKWKDEQIAEWYFSLLWGV